MEENTVMAVEEAMLNAADQYKPERAGGIVVRDTLIGAGIGATIAVAVCKGPAAFKWAKNKITGRKARKAAKKAACTDENGNDVEATVEE